MQLLQGTMLCYGLRVFASFVESLLVNLFTSSPPPYNHFERASLDNVMTGDHLRYTEVVVPVSSVTSIMIPSTSSSTAKGGGVEKIGMRKMNGHAATSSSVGLAPPKCSKDVCKDRARE